MEHNYILKEIDKPIRDIVVMLNKLFFINKTHASCSGHIGLPDCPYIDIEFKFCIHTVNYIDEFIRNIKNIKGAIIRMRKKKIYHISFDWDGTQENLNYIWSKFRLIINKFLKLPEPQHQCWR